MPALVGTERGAVPTPPLAELFHVAPLPRWRAIFAIVCAGAAFLCAGGMLEYGTGSPETHGTRAATYWALLFALHVVAFGGAGLLAAFPALARPLTKLAWLGLVMAICGFALAVWERQQPAEMASLSAWLARWPAYLAAIVVTLIGLCLPRTSSIPDDAVP